MRTETAITAEPLLRVTALKKHFPVTSGAFLKRRTGTIKAVDGVSFEVRAGETLGIVGESGCGKSTLGRTLLRLYEPTEGNIYLEGTDIGTLGRRALIEKRKSIQMIFQDPYASLDPRMTVADIVSEPMLVHGGYTAKARLARVAELLTMVELNPVLADRYPHEFSGGQRQRIGIARALALNPKIVVCDEPISALDVSIQAQVINLLQGLQRRLGLALIFISHDLGMVRHISDRVAVMYLGKIVEIADRDTLFREPLHPYTRALLSAVCVPDPTFDMSGTEILLEGDPPSPANPPPGCNFNTRCPHVMPVCRDITPPLALHRGRLAACHLLEPEVATA